MPPSNKNSKIEAIDLESKNLDQSSDLNNNYETIRSQGSPGKVGTPTAAPSFRPSFFPSSQPTSQPSGQPSYQPSGQPSSQPSGQPTFQPSNLVTARPSNGIAASNLSSNRVLNNGEIAGIAVSGGFMVFMGLMCYLGSYITKKLVKSNVAVSTNDIEINIQGNGGGGRV